MIPLKDLKAFLIDIDGVLVRGKKVLPGAGEFISLLRKEGKKFLLLTNNSTYTPLGISRFFGRHGITIKSSEVFTSSRGVGTYLKNEISPTGKVYVVGSRPLKRSLKTYGWQVSQDEKVDAVVVGLDRNFTYRKLQEAMLRVRAGAPLIGANPDSSFPAEDGRMEPGGGSLVRAVETASGVKAIIIGKPEGKMVELALKALGTFRKVTALVGDRLDIDVLTAQHHNLYSILVLTGVTLKDELATSPNLTPDLVVKDLPELINLFHT